MSAEAEELRELTRAAHEAIKDMKRERRELDDHLKAVRKEFHEMFDRHAIHIINDGLTLYSTTINDAIESASKAVLKRFDDLADILLAEDPASKRKGSPTMHDLVLRVKEQRG